MMLEEEDRISDESERFSVDFYRVSKDTYEITVDQPIIIKTSSGKPDYVSYLLSSDVTF